MPNLNKKKIIFAFEQMGGIDAILPVVKKIQNNKNYESFVFFDNKIILNYAKREGVKNVKLVGIFNLEKAIKKINPDLIFTDTNSTEYKNSIDKRLIKIAKEIKKPIINFVDSWMNYPARFGQKLEYIPDCILAIDEEMKNDLVKIGITDKKIKITGSPRFDKFSIVKKNKSRKGVIIFYSEAAITPKNFENIAKILENKFPEREIIIKFHPTREKDASKYDAIIKKLKLKVEKVKSDVSTLELSKKAEAVVGMNSIVLVDATLLGKKVFEYNPEKNILVDKTDYQRKLSNKYAKDKSTEEVIKFINEKISKK